MLAKLEAGLAGVVEEARLGAERSRYRAGGALIVAGLWRVAIGVTALTALIVLFFALDIGNEIPVFGWVVFLALGLLIAIVSLYALYVVLAATGNRIHLFDGGFVHLHPTKNARVFRWEDVELHGEISRHVKSYGARLDRSIRLDPAIRVRNLDGAELKVTEDSITQGAELISKIQHNVTQVRLPNMMHDIAEGRRLEFGSVVVDRHGVTAEDKTVRWPDVSGFVYVSLLSLGSISLAHSGTEELDVGFDDDIPNLALLVALVETLRSDATRTG
ncbi:DUF6585 family protein [Nocardia sp. NPDC052112]|uniref:DUF6585 family protein n=1 Tax=Nocardia sp. NPDC052112 TaxID=3155646 RepID=UPI00341A3C6D